MHGVKNIELKEIISFDKENIVTLPSAFNTNVSYNR